MTERSDGSASRRAWSISRSASIGAEPQVALLLARAHEVVAAAQRVDEAVDGERGEQAPQPRPVAGEAAGGLDRLRHVEVEDQPRARAPQRAHEQRPARERDHGVGPVERGRQPAGVLRVVADAGQPVDLRRRRADPGEPHVRVGAQHARQLERADARAAATWPSSRSAATTSRRGRTLIRRRRPSSTYCPARKGASGVRASARTSRSCQPRTPSTRGSPRSTSRPACSSSVARVAQREPAQVRRVEQARGLARPAALADQPPEHEQVRTFGSETTAVPPGSSRPTAAARSAVHGSTRCSSTSAAITQSKRAELRRGVARAPLHVGADRRGRAARARRPRSPRRARCPPPPRPGAA